MKDSTQTTKTCSTCKHWKDEPYSPYPEVEGLDVHECKVVDPYWEASEHRDDDYEKKYMTDIGKNRLAFAQDGSGYMAWLLTKAEFGCNMWEAKS